ncbi:beta-ketoacyl-ACP synthase [Ancylobacter vacuolatus]|uniref:3-oxoacyl-[acyl-carrier-protein] synthase II n=1 Tax=Ancylobacter vacuolatus TaxID=223389 RepID=A0ABU0DHI3_9HYPH|nr:beta-ketoacyl-ACP synthase [Ancylobacter vacuolatus]MDQ0347884.1 3-oxoacyl-[acyl-carrier-protein] synthase II [Ancylobacter vacuolatus]
MSNRRDVWITGIGLVSSLGEGPEAHRLALSSGTAPVVNETGFAPYVVHPLAPISFDAQIPKKGDQRQMEPWQRIGTYAAGLALDSAGIKGDKDILGTTDMVVAAGGGERDQSVDGAILTEIENQPNPEVFLNEQLQSNLRPTLFLAQLSNLLAGNISIVHGVTGSSRTFMGEESSGTDAVRIGWSRIAAGTSEIALVGGAYNAERRDMLLLFALKRLAMHAPWAPVLAQPKGVPTGSAGAFLVLESPEHATARGAKPIAKLSGVWSERARRNEPGAVEAVLEELLKTAGAGNGDETAVFSAASGAPEPTQAEAAVLARSGLPVRSVTDRVGHGLEAQMPVALAMAALSVAEGRLFAPLAGETLEKPFDGPLSRAIVTAVGHWRGEGVALVERAD